MRRCRPNGVICMGVGRRTSVLVRKRPARIIENIRERPSSFRLRLSMTKSLRLAIPVLFAARTLAAQTPVDSALLAYINSVKAIDGHAHPMRVVAPGAPADTDFDALPLDGIPPFQLPWRLTLDAPIW